LSSQIQEVVFESPREPTFENLKEKMSHSTDLTSSPQPDSGRNTEAYRRALDRAAKDAWSRAAHLPLRVGRAGQLDVDLLDGELVSILKGELFKALALLNPQIKDKYEIEITSLLQFIMYRLSIYVNGATYGTSMQNLHYQNELGTNPKLAKWQKLSYILMHVGGRWGWLRLSRLASTQDWSDQNDWRSRAWVWMDNVEKVWKALSLANFLVFLYDGRYKSLIDRILGMRLTYIRKDVQHQISHEFMNRQLVWTAFTEFLLFILPLINLSRMRNTLGRMFSKSNSIDLPPQICAICYQNEQASANSNTESLGMGTTTSGPFSSGTGNRAVNPYVTNCGHVFCYYCLKTATMVDSDYHCPRCLTRVEGMERWNGDISSVEKIE
jgi:peroxin-2